MRHCSLRDASRTFLLIFAVAAISVSTWGQGAKRTGPEGTTAPHVEKEAEGAADQVRERQQWLRSGRTALGENSADLLHRAYQQKMKMRAARLATSAQVYANSPSPAGSGSIAPPNTNATPSFAYLNWTNLGPAPIISDPARSYGLITGRVTAIAVDPKDTSGNTVYVGGAFGGVWKSINAATSNPTWTPIFDAQPTLSIGSIVIQPGSNTILVGTGEPNNSGDSYYGMGIFRSTDGGANWAPPISSADGGTRSFHGLGIGAIAFNTAGNIAVLSAAATIATSDGGETQGASGRGLYYSQDGGQTWAYANVQDPSGTIQAGSSNAVVFNPATNAFYAHMRYHGYYSSTDGAHWARLNNQPGSSLTTANCPAVTSTSTCPIYRADLTVRTDPGPNFGDMYTIFVDSSGNNLGIYRSVPVTNQPVIWSRMGQAGIDSCGDIGTNPGCGTQQGTFNLYLRAVPNGANTDLYMGAINIFKCSASPSDLFCGASGAWKNLTHAYGCSPLAAPAHVHPDQHAIGYAQSNPSIIYFGNDGGLYRTLTSSGLNSDSCAALNPFQNLNGSLGSLSEFVWFSQHPSDQNIILGGLQDNGSPAVNLSMGSTWTDVNSGDGGFNAIDPTSPDTFYTANNGVSIQRCASGLACNPGSWTNILDISGNLSGDGSAFYMPYLLDPAIPSKLIVGTCRVWRGNGDGTAFAPLSYNFTQNLATPGSTTSCSGDSGSGDTKIRSLAVGGINNGNGSEVIYAGMSGQQPLAGHVFVTTDANDTPATWADVTANINPSAYDISDIVISPHDQTGATAYLTIMGFGGGHVFKTINFGANWTDLTANLPDAPANSIAVDPTHANILYLGMDVGVFVSTDDGATWSELGSGLPSVPAIKLLTFDSNGVRKLRAATYGRGIWQIDLPTATISFSVNSLAFATVVGHTSGSRIITLSNSSPNTVNISSIVSSTGEFVQSNTCLSSLSPGASCSIAITFTPLASGARGGSIVVTDDAQGSPHTMSLNGTGVDFTLIPSRPGRPSRSSASTVVIAGQSAVFNFSVRPSGLGNLDATRSSTSDLQIMLQCSGLPTHATCDVQPRLIDLTQKEISVVVTVRTAGNVSGSVRASRRSKRLRNSSGGTPAGAYTVHISSPSNGAPRSVDFPLAVR